MGACIAGERVLFGLGRLESKDNDWCVSRHARWASAC